MAAFHAALTLFSLIYLCTTVGAQTDMPATWPACDFYVNRENGDDGGGGDTPDSAFATLACATDPNCNNGLQTGSVVCLEPGEHEIYDTVRVKRGITLQPYGPVHSAILDGMGQTQILYLGSGLSVTLRGLVFTNGKAGTGAAVYSEFELTIDQCRFVDNEGTLDAAAVMVTRSARISNSEFIDNKAVFGGALRISDIGSVDFVNCSFVRNIAERKGGAFVTQIEKPETQFVNVINSTFCFNDSPEGPHVYNFRTDGHKCTGCSFNTRACCSNHGKVITNTAKTEQSPHSKRCECDAGWIGPDCSTALQSHVASGEL